MDKPGIQQAREDVSYYSQKRATAKDSEARIDSCVGPEKVNRKEETMAESEDKSLATRGRADVKSIEDIKQEVTLLDKFYKELMQSGTDYGTIPGTDKPTLYKSGAELLRLRFGFETRFEFTNIVKDRESGYYEYEVLCHVYDKGTLVADGVGACNSMESRHRYRWVFPSKLPPDIDKSKLATRTVRTRSGNTQQYRLENENPQDLQNTILKMAKKRAFVDAILTATGASRIFTQDVEDFYEAEYHETTRSDESATKNEQTGRDPESITNMGQLMSACGQDFGLKRGDVLAKLGVSDTSELVETPADCYKRIKAAYR